MSVGVGVQVGGIVTASDVSLISYSCCVTDQLKSELVMLAPPSSRGGDHSSVTIYPPSLVLTRAGTDRFVGGEVKVLLFSFSGIKGHERYSRVPTASSKLVLHIGSF